MYKRILVPIDGSETSNAALQEAVKLAKDQESQIRPLHVVDLTMAYSAVEALYIFEYRRAMEEEGRKFSPTARHCRVLQGCNAIEMRGDLCQARLRGD